jgi:hypothetical protein
VLIEENTALRFRSLKTGDAVWKLWANMPDDQDLGK